MIQRRRSYSEKSTIVRSKSRRESGDFHRGDRSGRLVRRHGRRLAAHLARRPGLLAARTESGSDRLIVGVLSLIAVGYGSAVLARIFVQYGL